MSAVTSSQTGLILIRSVSRLAIARLRTRSGVRLNRPIMRFLDGSGTLERRCRARDAQGTTMAFQVLDNGLSSRHMIFGTRPRQ